MTSPILKMLQEDSQPYPHRRFHHLKSIDLCMTHMSSQEQQNSKKKSMNITTHSLISGCICNLTERQACMVRYPVKDHRLSCIMGVENFAQNLGNNHKVCFCGNYNKALRVSVQSR
jgi:hypothetical protein